MPPTPHGGHDLDDGLASVMIAETHDIVTALNSRARLDRIIEGTVATTGAVHLHDGTEASAGDLVITRRNDRRLRAGRGFVKNGDRWTVTATGRDGSATVRRAGHRFGASVTLPASYVADELELGYALTAHRAQGSTVDTAHAIVQGTAMTREAFYVAMTRGRQANTAYVATDHPDDTHAHPHPDDQENSTARAVLSGVLQHVGAEPSGHETIRAEQEAWSNIAQLAAEYETIAAAAQRDRWIHLVQHTGLTEKQIDQVIESPAFGPLTAELRRAEAHHHNVDVLLPRLVAARGFEDADDIAAVLHHRLAKATTRRTGSSRGTPTPRLIAGLIPEATGPMDNQMRQALAERQRLIEQRATALAKAAFEEQAVWIIRLGPPPRDPRPRSPLDEAGENHRRISGTVPYHHRRPAWHTGRQRRTTVRPSPRRSRARPCPNAGNASDATAADIKASPARSASLIEGGRLSLRGGHGINRSSSPAPASSGADHPWSGRRCPGQ